MGTVWTLGEKLTGKPRGREEAAKDGRGGSGDEGHAVGGREEERKEPQS